MIQEARGCNIVGAHGRYLVMAQTGTNLHLPPDACLPLLPVVIVFYWAKRAKNAKRAHHMIITLDRACDLTVGA